MTYKDWCIHCKEVLAEAAAYNEWRLKAKHNLLMKVGPRIAKIDETGYSGCGFHYAKEQTFGKLVAELSMPWQPTANRCKNVEDDRAKAIVNQVLYSSLLEEIAEAEKTA